MNHSISVIITGATGMVGEGVLHICLQHTTVEKVLFINRKPCGVAHPKLKEIIQPDFLSLSPVAGEFRGYTACFFCLGITSVGMKEQVYFTITHTLTLHMANLLVQQNPDMSFCYISGAGTDSTEKGKSMWARVKGKTENDLLQLPFKKVFVLRPGFIRPIKGMQHTHRFYQYLLWLYPIGRKLYPAGFCTLEELAVCMIRLALKRYHKRVIEGKDIIRIAASVR
jgi:uncharacterized protein YbjT (DUF2867 family)